MFKILGADGRQYGPVSAEQLRRWIAEGRANASTQAAEGSAEWKPLGSFPEFAAHFQLAAPVPMGQWTAHPRKTNGYALWGLICAILAVCSCCCCCLSIPLGALGLIFSLIGLSQINEFPDVYEGRAAAIIGIVLSALGLFLGILFLFPNFLGGNFYPPRYHWNFHQP